MKYQYILNDKIIFETNDASEYMLYLLTNKEAEQIKYSVLFRLLEQSNGHICNMVSVN
jgi:hypothetical protein